MTTLLHDDRFPRSAHYDRDWLVDGCFGAHPLWLCEWLAQRLPLHPGMRILDLGCGRAKSSIFLAQEFGVSVWAADLWISPTDNWRRVEAAGLTHLVFPLHVDARSLPFPAGFFDVILAIDSYQYYGTDDLFLPYLLQFLKPDGVVAFASAGVMQEIVHPVPEHLARFWQADTWCIHSADWWANHWARTGMVTVRVAESLSEGWKLWLQWARATEASAWYIKTLEHDQGRYLGYIRVIAHRRQDAAGLPYDLKTGRPI